MNRQGTILHFAGFIILIAFLSYLIFYVPEFDLSKHVLEKQETCRIKIADNSVVIVEGRNHTFYAEIYSDVPGVYELNLINSPHFADTEQNVFVPAKGTTKIEIFLFNATVSEDYNIYWQHAVLRASGPAECEAGFSVILEDNCLEFFNPDQTDTDGDGIGDPCDDAICNNSVCEPGEDMYNCCNDCGCLPGQTCLNNVCVGTPFECSTDADCDDGIGCTIDICFYANTSDSKCGHVEIIQCSMGYSDDCCPYGCNANTDIDCESVCGNGICEDIFGNESYDNCRRDCPNPED